MIKPELHQYDQLCDLNVFEFICSSENGSKSVLLYCPLLERMASKFGKALHKL